MQLINPVNIPTSLFLRATLAANYTGAFVTPLGVVWTAGDFTVGQPKRITVLPRYTKAKVTAGIYVSSPAVNGSVSLSIMKNTDETGALSDRYASQSCGLSAVGSADILLNVTTGEIPVIAGDFFTLRLAWTGPAPTAIQAAPMTFLSVELIP